MNLLRWLLFPLALLYGSITWVRNFLYNRGVLKSQGFDVPIISIGNLSMGGSGKSPMTEYLVRLLSSQKNIGIVSRGYGRKTKGVREVTEKSAASEVGDEPLQFKSKFTEVPVWVSEQRIEGIQVLLKSNPKTNLILLDDAFQHRQVTPKIAVLLMEYKDVLQGQYPFPMGRLREWMSGIRRADLVVITKCPNTVGEEEQNRLRMRLGLSNDSKLYFSSIEYGLIQAVHAGLSPIALNTELSVLVVTGIANPEPFLQHIRAQAKDVRSIRFKDHHSFTKSDLESIRMAYDTMPGKQKIVLCTEKDYMRIKDKALMLHTEKLPLYYLPIETVLQSNLKGSFDEEIKALLTHS